MAVLEDIRNKGGIIVSIVIGLALIAFIVGDFLPGRGGQRNLDLAKVGGTTLTVPEYENKVTEISNMYRQSQSTMNDDIIHDQAWQIMLSETIMKEQYEQTGLTVSAEELFDIVQGANPSPQIRQYFSDPQTGEFNRSALINFLKTKNSDPEAVQQWNMLEKGLLGERYEQKYRNLVTAGMYVPAFMAENENMETNRKVDFDYVIKPYASVPDSSVKVTAAELKTYYEKHKKQWEQTASRDIEYVVFDVVPSHEDRAAADEWMAKIKPEFEQAANAEQFVRLNSKAPFDGRFLLREQLPVQAADLFDAEAGTMVGPYQEGESLYLVKLHKVENRPDSVKVRQIILMPSEQTQQAFQNAVTLADSIKTAIEGGANFAALTARYSADPGVAATNGDIGWIHESDMQMQGNPMAETLFSMKRNEVAKMENPQGIFVFQVTERGTEMKKVQLATLQYNIRPSTRTEQAIYAEASKFAIGSRTSEQFDATTTAQNLSKRVATYIGENDRQIPGLSSARPVVRWAYTAKTGEVSDVFSLPDAYVIAVLKNVRKEGFASLEQVSPEIDLIVRREKQAAQIAATLSEAAKNAQSFSDMAIDLNLPVESESGIAFSAYTTLSAGVEPKLIAAASSMGEGNISQPVDGMNGVYLITVKQIVQPEEGTLEEAKERLSITYANRAMSETLQALRKAANIKDMRSKFY